MKKMFVAFETVTLRGTMKRSEIFEDISPPESEEELRDLEKYIRNLLYSDSDSCLITILSFQEVKSEEKESTNISGFKKVTEKDLEIRSRIMYGWYIPAVDKEGRLCQDFEQAQNLSSALASMKKKRPELVVDEEYLNFLYSYNPS